MIDHLSRSRIRWRPAVVILLLGALAHVALRLWPISQMQVRNLFLLAGGGLTVLLLVLWWIFASRARWGLRFVVLALFFALGGSLAWALRFRGVTGDLIPIFEPRWARQAVPAPARGDNSGTLEQSGRPDFPQYLGPERNAVLADGAKLARDWRKAPPEILWRQPIGPAWSGFAIVGNRAVTFEQRGDQEVVVCLDVLTGQLLWEHADAARYQSALGGEGPRSTPTIADGRVYTFGATGLLNCLDLPTGKRLWQRDVGKDVPDALPEWGYAGSPLLHEGKVIVSAGQSDGTSLVAYRRTDGEIAWQAGSQPAAYSSPAFCTLAGVPQIVIFNMRFITAHDPLTGAVLWKYPWGDGRPVVAQPMVVPPDRIVFSSGYGVGAELLELRRDAAGKLSPERLWKSIALKAKMSSFVHRDGFLYGLDDGMLTCVDLRDGSRKWKGGRYGHGQILLVGDLLLATAEDGRILLVEPTPDEFRELTSFRVFHGKTWNPPALSGDLLLLRTEREVACLRLPVAK